MKCQVFRVATVLVLALLATAGNPKEPSVSVRLIQKPGSEKATFEVTGLAPEDLAQLATLKWEPTRWAALFAVSVGGADKAREAERPPMLGSYHVDQKVLRFEPRFPLTPGLSYRAVFDPSKLPRPRSGEPVRAWFTLPKSPAMATTVVQQVYPTASQLSENQLRFYIQFSAPMSRGEAYKRLQILDPTGKAVDHPFLELDEELWDPRGRRFTVFLHPGRVKRGLKPREELGPILEEGKTYTLVIDQRWSDAKGDPLKESFRKTFRVTAPDERPPDPKNWKLQAPPAGTRTPLTVRFPKPLDHGLLQRMLWVVDADSQKVAGNVAIAGEETVWRFTPERSWQAGAYRLMADTRLEDLAGNSIARPFDVDVFDPVQREVKAATVAVPFQVKAK
jgi:hypothetical protein